ncbi:MAG: nicotinate phosphoribosyltransferase [Thermoanaerobaculia bacterium]
MREPSRLDPLTLEEGDLAFATDLYQLTMAAVYHRRAPERRGSFELFVRSLPRDRNFLVFAGLEQALAALRQLAFGDEQIAYLRSLQPFQGVTDSFFDALCAFRFRGNVTAMPEGTIFFPEEPVLRVTGSLLEAQIVETLLLSTVNFQTMVASKAARVRLAAEGIGLAEFGGRRAHGPQAATWVARAAYLAGFDSTSNVLAGQRLGIPVTGTMAHSFILAFESESEAFRNYVETFPQHTTFLVDTYDSLDGVRHALELGVPFAAVRLDSGDLAALSRAVRELLDEAGRRDVKVFASGDLNERKIARLRAERVPIDAFGVGTQLATSADAPYVGGIYKLVDVEVNGEVVPRQKLSAGKRTWPGKKQVYRLTVDGRMAGDRITLADDEPAGGEEPLLEPVMVEGRLLVHPTLETARERCRTQLDALPEPLRRLESAIHPYPVERDPGLERAAAEIGTVVPTRVG